MNAKGHMFLGIVLGSAVSVAGMSVVMSPKSTSGQTSADQAEMHAALLRLERRLDQLSQGPLAARSAEVNTVGAVGRALRNQEARGADALSNTGASGENTATIATGQVVTGEAQKMSAVDQERAMRAPDETKQLVASALASKIWRSEDREHLNAMLPYLGPEGQRIRLGLIAAVNSGRLKIEPHMHGMPF